MGGVDEPLPTPTSLPDPGDVKLGDELGEERHKYEGVDRNAHIRTGSDTCFGKSATN
jgi:hypothetical protein